MRLISFGCSHTQGQGIIVEDTHDMPCDSSWSGQLSKLLNIEHINTAQTAASNFEIHNTIRNFNFQKDDIAVVLFSYFTRDIIYNECEDNIRIIPYLEIPGFILKKNNRDEIQYHQNRSNLRKNYYNVHNDFDLLKSNFIAIHNIYNELQNKNLSSFCRFSVLPVDDMIKINNQRTNENTVEKLLKESWHYQLYEDIQKTTLRSLGNSIDYSLRRGVDGSHWSYQVHTLMANEYYNEITSKV